ncbi:SRPBCC family protein [Nocardioidaceae bacterium]|nr:SRPBCC family protein [Nocardioidaceae bacterium]
MSRTSRPMTVSDSVEVAVAPGVAYAAFSDVSQMGRWSPENRGADAEPGKALTVGDRFTGRNRRGRVSWQTSCVVTAADAPHHFAFTVDTWGVRKPWLKAPVATWDYRFEPTETGVRVQQTWIDERTSWPDWAARAFDKVATGTTFARFQRGNIARTLARFKRELENGERSPS